MPVPLLERIGAQQVGPLTVAEWAPTPALVAFGVLDAYGGAPRILGPPAVVAGAVTVAAFAVATRRRFPVAVLVTVGAALSLPATVWGASQLLSSVLCVVVALYSCGRYGRRPGAWSALPIGVAIVFIQEWLDPIDSIAASWSWSLNVFWIFGLGAWVRQSALTAQRAQAEAEARTQAAAADARVQIARDLHDVLAHSLAVMVVQAEAADVLMDSEPQTAHRAIDRVQSTGRAALRDIRGLLAALRAADAEALQPTGPDLDAVPVLVDVLRESGLPVTYLVAGEVCSLPAPPSRAAFRVIQEALTNTLRHAGPVDTVVSVEVGDEQVSVRVHDIGQPGLTATVESSAGHGLRGMRERIEGLGGTLLAGPDAAGGFTVHAVLPRTASL